MAFTDVNAPMTEVEAAEAIALANMALAEVGVESHYFITRCQLGRGYTVGWKPTADDAAFDTARKAIRLARLRLRGPESLARCDAHPKSDLSCGFVGVADALLGRFCHLINNNSEGK